MFFDLPTQKALLDGREELVRQDFQATSGLIRVAVGTRLVRLGLRLAGPDLLLVRREAQVRTEAVP